MHIRNTQGAVPEELGATKEEPEEKEEEVPEEEKVDHSERVEQLELDLERERESVKL